MATKTGEALDGVELTYAALGFGDLRSCWQ